VFSINIRRLGWAGRILRIEYEGILEKVFNGKFHNTKPVGKPRTSWKDVVWSNTSEILGMRGWKRRVENREEWRRLLREVREQKVL
jgi:hypothetical protein